MTIETTTSWVDTFNESLMRTMGQPLALLTHGRGAFVWDENEKEYLDFLAGIAVNSLGHAHPVLIDALTRQVSTLAHVSNYFSTRPQLQLAERLKRITGAGPAGRAYFCNSGAEANEAAFKLARLNSSPARPTIVSLKNSFHGRTMGALALTGKPDMQAPFEPLPGGVIHIDSTIEALEATIDDTVAALFLEPIKGEAGVINLPEGYLARARQLTEEHGVLLILDEIQTGVGRTGRWFNYEYAGILPDAVTIAKGMAGGVPIGSLVTFGWASDLFQRGMHGSTFGGNPLATAAANAVLGEIEERDLVGNAERRGIQLRDRIAALNSPLIGEIRGQGLLMGLGLTEPIALKLAAAAMDAGLIINAANESSIRMAPPLIIRDLEVDAFIARFTVALAAVGFPAAPTPASTPTTAPTTEGPA
ncbi:acetylornithine transaminase [Subtercola boreus]|uniref:Acetylornithine aminotransferase n=1 Tax=Subtercola boreus TaxID=120213 RepID=A0A3E0WDP0_9MICO|nr:acetylornithine transaminase [Subtercola boreus]RFA21857.1 acetylornithine aminotransferase [Subtercola boreus]RFA21968.1 acetylornithine aminotransferase [Subtercola boreus]RFA27916.1 acetylornithine aminotransferase [Subtercola boreus]